jgi:hypothetical protein
MTQSSLKRGNVRLLHWLTIGCVALAGCSKSGCATKGDATVKLSAAQPALVVPGESLRHLPAGCGVAGTFDWKQLAGSPRIAAHRDEAQQAIAKQGAPRLPMLSRLFEQLGVSAQDGVERGAFCLREVPLGQAVPERNAPFVVALSGPFQQKAPLDAMVQLAAPGTFRERELGGLRALQRGARLFVQARDQVLLVSNDEQLLQSALVASDAHQAYDLARGPALALVASDAVTRKLEPAGERGQVAHPIQVELAKAKRLDARLSLAPGELVVALTMATEKEALESSSRLERVLSPLMQDGAHLAELKQRVPPELLAALRGIRFKADGVKVVVTAPLPDAALGALLHGFGALSALSQSTAQGARAGEGAGEAAP